MICTVPQVASELFRGTENTLISLYLSLDKVLGEPGMHNLNWVCVELQGLNSTSYLHMHIRTCMNVIGECPPHYHEPCMVVVHILYG